MAIFKPSNSICQLAHLIYIVGRTKISPWFQYFIKQRSNNQMENEFECTKIKDGLYLGTLATTQDYEFLQINKFAYVINCSAEIPNYFDNHGIKYLKFKLIKERTHKLWDENLKKLRKLEKFIEQAEEQSLCCIIFSAGGNNRSLVMLSAFLMSKYRWSLSKTLEYVRSKNIFIGLSEHYISQLEQLESLLDSEEDKVKLTNGWKGPYANDQEEIISKTFLNSQELPIERGEKKQKKEKRVTWQDKIDKDKKKEVKDNKLRQTGIEQFKKTKSGNKFIEEPSISQNSLSTKVLKKEQPESPLKKSQNLKKGKKNGKNISINKMETICDLKEDKENMVDFQESQQQLDVPKPLKKTQSGKYFSQKELIKLIKKNLKLKKEEENPKDEANQNNGKQPQSEKGIYRLTINNYIQPNINIMNTVPQEKCPNDKLMKTAIPKPKAKEEKNGRAQSEKESTVKTVNDSLKGKTDKNKSYKRNTQNSPKHRQRKLEKAVSLQFRKNN